MRDSTRRPSSKQEFVNVRKCQYVSRRLGRLTVLISERASIGVSDRIALRSSPDLLNSPRLLKLSNQNLLASQGIYGIDCGGAPRRQVSRAECHDTSNCNRECKGNRVKSGHFKEHCFQKLPRPRAVTR